MVGPIVGTSILEHYGEAAVFQSATALATLNCLYMLLVPESRFPQDKYTDSTQVNTKKQKGGCRTSCIIVVV